MFGWKVYRSRCTRYTTLGLSDAGLDFLAFRKRSASVSGQSDPHVGLGIAQWEAMRCEGAQISTYLFAKLFRLMVPLRLQRDSRCAVDLYSENGE
jgi:hypothetical protein